MRSSVSVAARMRIDGRSPPNRYSRAFRGDPEVDLAQMSHQVLGEDEFPPGGRGDRLAGEVVRGGPDPARRHQHLGLAERLPEHRGDPGPIVPDGRFVEQIQPDRSEVAGDDGRIGV